MVDNGTPAKRRKILLQALDKSPGNTSGKSTVTGDEDYEEIELPSDVAAAIAFLRQECVNSQAAANIGFKKYSEDTLPKLLPPLVLMTQLYSIVNDKRAIELEVDDMRKRNKIRLLKLPTGPDEHGVMTIEDYRQFVLDAAAATSAAGSQAAGVTNDNSDAAHSRVTSGEGSGSIRLQHPNQCDVTPAIAIAHAFCDRVLPRHNEVTISKTLLLEYLNKPCIEDGATPGSQLSGPQVQRGKDAVSSLQQLIPSNKDEQLTTLLQLGVVSRHPMDDNMLVFCCPGMGLVIKSIMAGRKELLSLIAKKPHSEIPELSLLGRSLGRSSSNHTNNCAARLQEGGFLRDINFNFPPSTPTRKKQSRDEEGTARTPVTQALTISFNQSLSSTGTPPSLSKLTKSGGVKLRQSVLGVAYHLRDLLGRGDLVRVYAPSGSFIRLSRHTADLKSSGNSRR